MALIIVENVFVHLCLILVLLGATGALGVGADTTNVVNIKNIYHGRARAMLKAVNKLVQVHKILPDLLCNPLL
jgi:hypothetical protein